MSAYLWVMLAGSLVVFALYGFRCAGAVRLPDLRKNAWLTALLAFLFSALFGTVLARCGYALLMSELDFEYDGIEALGQLLEFEIDAVSFFCGAAGVILGVLLANRLTRKGSVITGMDAFAPFGALLAALFRLGECFFGSYGAGAVLPEGSPLAFFPFAVKISVAGSNQDTWRWAVFALSAAFALIWAGISFFRLRGSAEGLCRPSGDGITGARIQDIDRAEHVFLKGFRSVFSAVNFAGRDIEDPAPGLFCRHLKDRLRSQNSRHHRLNRMAPVDGRVGISCCMDQIVGKRIGILFRGKRLQGIKRKVGNIPALHPVPEALFHSFTASSCRQDLYLPALIRIVYIHLRQDIDHRRADQPGSACDQYGPALQCLPSAQSRPDTPQILQI